jgi:hypothetical protein
MEEDDPLLLDMVDPLRPEEDVDGPQLPSARVPKDTAHPLKMASRRTNS